MTATPTPTTTKQPRPFPTSQPLDPSKIYYTSFESNTFLLTYNSRRILVDPWLTSTLDFLTPSFSSSQKPLLNSSNPPTISQLLNPLPDLILISQSLPDHLHEPTLKLLPKHIPIVGASSTIKKLRRLGFEDIRELDHGESFRPFEGVNIRATVGSVVGPPWQKPENGWLIRFEKSTESTEKDMEGEKEYRQVYMEPHGNHPPEIMNGELGRIDVVVSPVVHAYIGGINYDLVRGSESAIELLRRVRPGKFVVLMNHVSEMTGVLNRVLRSEGGTEEFKESVKGEGMETEVVVPETLKAVEIEGFEEEEEKEEVSQSRKFVTEKAEEYKVGGTVV